MACLRAEVSSTQGGALSPFLFFHNITTFSSRGISGGYQVDTGVDTVGDTQGIPGVTSHRAEVE